MCIPLQPPPPPPPQQQQQQQLTLTPHNTTLVIICHRHHHHHYPHIFGGHNSIILTSVIDWFGLLVGHLCCTRSWMLGLEACVHQIRKTNVSVCVYMCMVSFGRKGIEENCHPKMMSE